MAKKAGRVGGEAAPSSMAQEGEGAKEREADGAGKDTPTEALLSRRLRAARKKAKRADEIEALKASGRAINPDQEEALKGKAKTLAAIDELEKLAPLLREAVAEELDQRLAAKAEELEGAAAAAAALREAEQSKSRAEAAAKEAAAQAAAAEELRAAAAAASQRAQAAEAALAAERAGSDARAAEARDAERAGLEERLGRIVQLFYFAKLFSRDGGGEGAYIRQMERDACLTYDSTVTFEGEPLSAGDLDSIVAFGRLISTRPLTEIISHQAALERCKALALDWVQAADKHIPQLNTTVNELVVKFERIVGSDYFSIKPEIKGAPEAPPPQQQHGQAHLPHQAPHQPPFNRALEPRTAGLGGGGFGGPPAGFPGAPPGSQAGGGAALQQLLSAHRPSLASAPSAEHALPNGFVPSLSAEFVPAAGVSFAPAAFPGAGRQPHAFEPPQPHHGERAPGPEAGGPGLQFFGAGFQGASFGAVGKPESHAQPLGPKQALPGASGNGPVFMAPETPPAPEASPAPAELSPGSAEAAAERKPSQPPQQPPRQQPQGQPQLQGQAQGQAQAQAQGRPRVQPIDVPRGRGANRGARGHGAPGAGRGGGGGGGGSGGEFAGGGGGRGGRRGAFGGGNRGPRGRGPPREFGGQQQQQPHQQQPQQPAYHAPAAIPPAGAY